MIRQKFSLKGWRGMMADYIDRNILCQAYVHIETDGFSDQQLEDLKRHLALYIETRGRFFLYEDVATDVEFKDGSLKMYLTIAGALYIAISEYGSFRSGVDYLATDVKRLADCVASESLFLTKSRHDKTIRVEARIGVVGSLKNAVDKLRAISNELGHVPLGSSTTDIQSLRDDMERLLANLNDPSDPPYVANEFCKLVAELLAETPPFDPRRKPSDKQVAAYQRARRELLESVKLAAKQKPSTKAKRSGRKAKSKDQKED